MANIPAGIAPPPWASDEMNPPNTLDMDLDQPPIASADFEAGLHNLEHSFSFPASENEDPFKWLSSEFDSATVKTESREDFNFLGSNDDFTMGTIPDLDLDLDICSDLDYPESVSSPESFGPVGHESFPGYSSSPYDVFASPNEFDIRHTPQQPSSPSSLTSPFPTLATPSTQLTIRMEGADPSTLSAVMGTLIQSKARFRFETH
ncbi:uncharacterized protein KY384_004460 [Bacidia gigantensis]|uniref:uncharacterized protein n=1 Tax=Bacidia gigantensis TaxID=2732470 RepID=UPI001D0535CA|nr:uncharacterized protein KY384_004460 [Bacidia gigantensis]KAG8531103.1 hypothetical protein KY384_004460 [Bacidia gigantensis]